ncbi:DUF3027 domain-containing protein [Leucobacter sp. USHLN153]|uniref:DUF3027 domain-containing protein n=1 Tax=Leucobacter sp. USHLN153 TaxID=3081268 RepID=UPI00301A159D
MSEPEEPTTVENSMSLAPDSVLLESRDQARDALLEITSAASIGSPDGFEVNEEHVLTLFFECRLPGYPGWRWAATLARTDENAPVTVLEVELLPGAGAVVAPEWVPWSERLAQYRDAQAKQASESPDGENGDDGDDDADADVEFSGDEDFDDDHDDDIDGVELDEESMGVGDDDDELDADDEDDDEGLGDDADDTELFDDDSDDIDTDDVDSDDSDSAAEGSADNSAGDPRSRNAHPSEEE